VSSSQRQTSFMILEMTISTSSSEIKDNSSNIPKDDLLIVDETTGQFVPEMHKLLSGSSIGLVAANNSSTTRLLTGIVVSIRGRQSSCHHAKEQREQRPPTSYNYAGPKWHTPPAHP